MTSRVVTPQRGRDAGAPRPTGGCCHASGGSVPVSSPIGPVVPCRPCGAAPGRPTNRLPTDGPEQVRAVGAASRTTSRRGHRTVRGSPARSRTPPPGHDRQGVFTSILPGAGPVVSRSDHRPKRRRSISPAISGHEAAEALGGAGRSVGLLAQEALSNGVRARLCGRSRRGRPLRTPVRVLRRARGRVPRWRECRGERPGPVRRRRG